jgi:hypothetical protein
MDQAGALEDSEVKTRQAPMRREPPGLFHPLRERESGACGGFVFAYFSNGLKVCLRSADDVLELHVGD